MPYTRVTFTGAEELRSRRRIAFVHSLQEMIRLTLRRWSRKAEKFLTFLSGRQKPLSDETGGSFVRINQPWKPTRPRSMSGSVEADLPINESFLVKNADPARVQITKN